MANAPHSVAAVTLWHMLGIPGPFNVSAAAHAHATTAHARSVLPVRRRGKRAPRSCATAGARNAGRDLSGMSSTSWIYHKQYMAGGHIFNSLRAAPQSRGLPSSHKRCVECCVLVTQSPPRTPRHSSRTARLIAFEEPANGMLCTSSTAHGKRRRRRQQGSSVRR